MTNEEALQQAVTALAYLEEGSRHKLDREFAGECLDDLAAGPPNVRELVVEARAQARK